MVFMACARSSDKTNVRDSHIQQQLGNKYYKRSVEKRREWAIKLRMKARLGEYIRNI